MKGAFSPNDVNQTPLLCSESAWLVAASVCLYDADAAAAVTSAVCCTEQRYQQRTLKSGTPFVVIGGLKSLCLTDENTYAPLEVDVSSWKRRVKKHLSIAKATYRQSEVPSANTRTTRSLENGANALLDEHQHSSTTMVLDHVAQDQYCEDDMIQENTVTSEPARALIQSLTNQNYARAMYQLDSILNDDDIKYDHMAHAVTMHNKGVVHLVSGDFQMAVVQFQQAIKAKRAIEGIDQKNYILETMEQMGIALYACRDIDSATSTFQKIISMAPNDSSISTRAWNALGCCFNQNQKEQFAMQCFVKSSQLGESLIGKIALANLGYYKYRLGDPRAVNVMRDASESLQDFLGSDDSIVSNVNNNTKLAICDGIPNNILAMIR